MRKRLENCDQWSAEEQQQQHHRINRDEYQIVSIDGSTCAISVELDSVCWWPIEERPKSSSSSKKGSEGGKRYRQHQRLQHHQRLDLSRILNVKLVKQDDATSNSPKHTAGDDDITKQQLEAAAATKSDTCKLVIYYVKPNEHQSSTKLLKLRELTIRSSKRHPSKYRHLTNANSENNNETDNNRCDNNIGLNELYERLQSSLEVCRQVRPKRLLIFVNPFGGKGQALRLYKRQVKRFLELADIEKKLIVTQYANHARETIEDPLFNVEYYDGIVSVGGDGMFSELMNGLLFRYNRSKILNAKLTKCEDLSGLKEQKADQVIAGWNKLLGGIGEPFVTPPIPLGMIGAGSTDANSFGFYGTNDVATSTLNILLGNQIQVDVSSVHSIDSDRLLKFVSTFVAYGYFGDIIRESERLRWMGPSRYEVTAMNVLMKMRTYKGLVRLIVSDADGSPHDSDVWCHNNCQVCQMNTPPSNPIHSLHSTASSTISSMIENDSSTANSHTSLTTASNHPQQLAGTPVDESGLGSNESILDGSSHKSMASAGPQSSCDNLRDEKETYTTTATTTPTQQTLADNPTIKSVVAQAHERDHDNSNKHKDELSRFRLIEQKGAFMGVNAAIMACRCPQTWKGFSPGNHLGNGCADLILVKPCSRVQYINYLLRTGVSKKSAFDLKYVDAFRCRQFEFISADDLDEMNDRSKLERERDKCCGNNHNHHHNHKSTSLSISLTESSDRSTSNNDVAVIDNDMTSQSASHSSGLDAHVSHWFATIASTASASSSSSASASASASSSTNNNNVAAATTTESARRRASQDTADKKLLRDQLAQSHRRRHECSSWNIDGEVLREQSIRVKVNKQLLSVFGTGEPQRMQSTAI